MSGGSLKLHLGCGSTVVPGWENIDMSLGARVPHRVRVALRKVGLLTADQAAAVFPPGIVHADVRKGLRYPDASASFVYSSHMIEHMARWQALRLLKECHRVLGPEGVIRIVTPDLALLVGEYVRGEAPVGTTPADAFVDQLWTFREAEGGRAQRVLRRLLTAPHQWLYDADSLRGLLREAGFANPEVKGFRESRLPDIERLEDRDGSLFVEAVR